MSGANEGEQKYPDARCRCPACGSGDFYRLADGRRQCRDCRKKYSRQSPRQPLSAGFQQGAAQLFWNMVPARQAAKTLGVNRKTMQRCYGRMRAAIARAQEEPKPVGTMQPGEAFTEKGFTVFWFILDRSGLRVHFPERGAESEPPIPRPQTLAAGVVSAPCRDSLCGLRLERFRQRTWWIDDTLPDTPQRRRVERFWVFARDRLRRYRGGYQGNFPLFVQEMAFRFNQNDRQSALAFLQRSLEDETGTDHTMTRQGES